MLKTPTNLPVPTAPPLLETDQQVPREKTKVALAPYRVEPPDILFIDALKVVPKAPYRISAQDLLTVQATGTLTPIGGTYAVEPGGSIDLGPGNGRVSVAGLSIDEATEAIQTQLSHVYEHSQVSVSLAQSAGQQQIQGEHIIAQDGRINLGIFGSVYVAGMTVDEVRHAVEQHLTAFLDNPRVAIDVGAYNSKVYYIINDNAGSGQGVSKYSIVGNETVLDALSNNNGILQVASKHHIWVARPAPNGAGCDQILPIHWDEITMQANTSTNYQLLPGDRIFIDSDKFYAVDIAMGKMIAPFEKVFGVTTLGFQSIFRIQHPQSVFGGAATSSRF